MYVIEAEILIDKYILSLITIGHKGDRFVLLSQREVRTLEKVKKMKLPDSEELMQASTPQTKEDRLSKLEEEYRALELQYSSVIERLAMK